jgi:hypothetical protein
VDVTSPFVMAVPPFAAGCAIALIGLLGPRRARIFVVATGLFVMLWALLGALVNIGIHVYGEEPLLIEGPVVALMLCGAIVTARASRRSRGDEDTGEDGDGGSGVRTRGPQPDPPAPAPVDWKEFDDLREDWSRQGWVGAGSA